MVQLWCFSQYMGTMEKPSLHRTTSQLSAPSWHSQHNSVLHQHNTSFHRILHSPHRCSHGQNILLKFCQSVTNFPPSLLLFLSFSPPSPLYSLPFSFLSPLPLLFLLFLSPFFLPSLYSFFSSFLLSFSPPSTLYSLPFSFLSPLPLLFLLFLSPFFLPSVSQSVSTSTAESEIKAVNHTLKWEVIANREMSYEGMEARAYHYAGG